MEAMNLLPQKFVLLFHLKNCIILLSREHLCDKFLISKGIAKYKQTKRLPTERYFLETARAERKAVRQGAIMRLGESTAMNIEAIPTGSLTLTPLRIAVCPEAEL